MSMHGRPSASPGTPHAKGQGAERARMQADAVLDALGLEQVEGWRFGVSPSRLTVDPSPHRREDECGRRGCTPVYRLASPSLTGGGG